MSEQQPLSAAQMAEVDGLASNLTAQQLLWVSGYLAGRAGMSATGAPPAHAAPEGPALTILYGSQTGNGEKLAEKLHAKAQERGYSVHLKDMADYKKNELKKEENLLMIVSTHGEGDPPDTSLELHEFIFSKRAPDLSKLNFSVLALGDTSYEHYCKTGRDFDQQLQKLGAKALFARQDCDVDYEEAAENWMEGALNAFAEVLTVAGGGAAVAMPTLTGAPVAPSQWNKSNPFRSTLLEYVNLNGRGSIKETLHMELLIEDSGLNYAPGDAVGILPDNRPELVDALIEKLGESPDTAVHLSADEVVPLRDALTQHYEITILTRPVVQKYAAISEATALQELLGEGRHKDLLAWTDGRDLLDLLEAYPVPGLTGQGFVDILRKLPPRLYSIASSLAAHPDEVHITVGVVNFRSHGRERAGVCSNYLKDLSEDAQIPIYIHENRNFKLPEDAQTPIIMIGPGTGVAPFRAFIEEREAIGATGGNWLFFGDQHFTTDFLYQAELLKYHKDGMLTHLDVAFSRDQKEKIYVQHRMQQKAAELHRWIEEGAYIYVCGDANRMAPDVHETLINIIADHGDRTREDAEHYVKQMLKEKRYQRDTY